MMRTGSTREKKTGRRGRRHAPPCPPGFYTAPQLRDRLGISQRQFHQLTAARVISASRQSETNSALYSEELLQMLLNRQADGSLFKYRQEEDGTVVPVAQPLLMPTAYTPEQGVQVLEMLHAQVPILQIVLQTKMLPQVVKRIQQEYDELVGSVTVPKMILDQMNKLTRLNGSFPLRSATDILAIMKTAEQDRSCPRCMKARSLALCGGCYRAELASIAEKNASNGEDHDGQDQSNGSSVLPSGSQPSGSSQNIRQP